MSFIKIMRYLYSIILVLLILAITAPGAFSAADQIPVVLSFELVQGDGASRDMVIEATQAVKFYLRDTGKADVVSFDVESPLVKRAVLEGRLKPENLVNLTAMEDQLVIAQALEANFILSGNVSYKNENAAVKMTLVEAGSKRKWQQDGSAAASGEGIQANQRNISNAIQSASSNAVSLLVSEAFKNIVAVDVKKPAEEAVVTPENDPKGVESYAKQADQDLAQGNTAGAIESYRKAINADPDNINYRLRLAMVYAKRGLTDLAADELKRAQEISPTNEEIRTALAKLYEETGKPDKAVEVYEAQTQRDPQNMDSWLSAGDLLWKQQKLDEAEQQYTNALKLDPNNVRPRERLLLLYTARGMFGESRKQIESLQKLYANAGDAALYERFDKLRPIIDLQLQTFLGKIRDNDQKFRDKKMVREDLYGIVQSVVPRLDSLSRFLEVIQVPQDLKQELARRSLAASLLTQSGHSLMTYLETNKADSRSDADMYMREADNQLKAVKSKL